MAQESAQSGLPPLSRDQLWGIVEILFVELNHLCQNAAEESLKAIPGFESIIPEYAADLRDPGNDAATLLRLALAYVDEYRYAERESVTDAIYSAYLIVSQRPGAGPSPPAA